MKRLILAVTLPCLVAGAQGWYATSTKVDHLERATIRLALRSASKSALGDVFETVSDPKSSRYRKFLTDEEVAHLVEPPPGTLKAVTDWVSSQLGEGAQVEQNRHGDGLLVSATRRSLLQAFAGHIVNFTSFQHADSPGRREVRAVAVDGASPSSVVPSALLPHVWAAFDLVDLLPVPVRRRERLGADPGDKVEPPVIHNQYNLTESECIGGRTGTSQAVAAFEQAQFLPTDVAAFEKAYGLPEVVFQVDGPNNGGYYGEAGLDTQYIVTTGRGVPSWFVAQNAFDMLTFCEKVLNMTERPSVLSISWGSGESDYDADHMQAANTCFQKMGVQGISVFVASGDQGTGKQGLFWCTGFDATWPASSPFVTAVGGTFLQSGVENGWTDSGGGFSSVFSRPSYQDSAVQAYVNSGVALPPGKFYTATGRAIPDVAALATNYQVYSGGIATGTLSGTSASTPVFAGMISVINDLLVAAGEPPVGFINPTLYSQTSTDFLGFDVTTGNNKNGGCSAGFAAGQGWDPVTGLGTPQWAKLKAVLMPSTVVV